MESASGFGGYLFAIGFVYVIYKIISMIQQKTKVQFSFWHLLGFSVLHIFIVAIVYTSSQNTTGSPFFVTSGASSIVLFFHIISLLIYPIFLGFLWRASGYSFLKMIPNWDSIPLRIRIG